MYIIGENIHIISPKVKEALQERDARSSLRWPNGNLRPARRRWT